MDIISSNEDQQCNFPSEEQLKFITDNRHQRKKNRTYADAVVNIPDDPAVFSTTNESSRSKLDNKTVLTSEELRGIYDIMISDKPKVVDTCSPVLSTNTSISENTSASYRTDCPRQEVASKNNSVSRLDEELLLILVDLQNHNSKENFAIRSSIVRSWDSGFGERVGIFTSLEITNESELQKDFEEFSRRMRIKWNFPNEP